MKLLSVALIASLALNGCAKKAGGRDDVAASAARDESAPVGDCGAADSAVHAEVRTGAAWLTGAGSSGTWTVPETSGAPSSPFFRPNRPHLRRPLASSDCAVATSGSGGWAGWAGWAAWAGAVGAHTGASGAA